MAPQEQFVELTLDSPKLTRRVRETFEPVGGVGINLASGTDYFPGWVNVDLYADRVDRRFNLEKLPWPIPSDGFDWAFADQILEHLPDRIGEQDGALAFLGEIHRILKPRGRAYVSVPHKDASRSTAYRNITHRRFFIPEAVHALDSDHDDADASVLAQAGFDFAVLDTILRRRLQFTRWFDSSYHFPKWLGRRFEIGRPDQITWILQKRSE